MFLERINQQNRRYLNEWQSFVSGCNDQLFFKSLKAQAVGWKTTDLAEFDKMFVELRDKCDQIHLGWVNERWLATMHLNSSLESGAKIIKLMQRRPNSTDSVGLDHIDFKIQDVDQAKAVLAKETSVKWTEETNNPHCSWISIWFSNTEAKLRTDSVVDVCIAELHEVSNLI